jgi:hypothetical protein
MLQTALFRVNLPHPSPPMCFIVPLIFQVQQAYAVSGCNVHLGQEGAWGRSE